MNLFVLLLLFFSFIRFKEICSFYRFRMNPSGKMDPAEFVNSLEACLEPICRSYVTNHPKSSHHGNKLTPSSFTSEEFGLLQIMCAGLCEISYARNIRRQLCNLSSQPPFQINEYLTFGMDDFPTTLRYFVVTTHKFMILVIRGSATWDDWLTNMNTSTTKKKGVECHSGFLERAQLIPTEFFSRMASDMGKTLVITGHSLGGAVAETAIRVNHLRSVIGITFGQPSAVYKCPPIHPSTILVRFYHQDDPITFITSTPPCLFPFQDDVFYVQADGPKMVLKSAQDFNSLRMFRIVASLALKFYFIPSLGMADVLIYIANHRSYFKIPNFMKRKELNVDPRYFERLYIDFPEISIRCWKDSKKLHIAVKQKSMLLNMPHITGVSLKIGAAAPLLGKFEFSTPLTKSKKSSADPNIPPFFKRKVSFEIDNPVPGRQAVTGSVRVYSLKQRTFSHVTFDEFNRHN